MIALTSTSHRRPTAAWAISGVADRPSQPQLAVTASACLLGLVKLLAHHVSNLPDGLGIVAHHESRLAAGECTDACVDRFLAESCAVATGETVPSRVLVQMALCAVTALSALSFGRPQDSPRVKSHRRRSRRETLSSMTTHPGANLVQRLWTSAILNGLLAVILGVVILLWPGPSILVAAVVFGVYLLVSGIAQVVSAFSLPASAGGRILLFISGAASVILAVLAFRHFGEGYAILLLAIWIAVGFIFRGVAATATAISDPAFPGRGWAIFFGIISILAGIVVLAWPFDSIVTLALVAGIWLIILGVMEIVAGFGMRSDAKKVEKKITGAAA